MTACIVNKYLYYCDSKALNILDGCLGKLRELAERLKCIYHIDIERCPPETFRVLKNKEMAELANTIFNC
jgi:hypothetical protein